MTLLSHIFTSNNVTNAFLGIAGRSVGGSYRYLESINPNFQQNGMTPPARTVMSREGVSLALSWVFTLLTSDAMTIFNKFLKLPGSLSKFLIIVIGNIIAEGVARTVAYRKINLQNRQSFSQATQNFPKTFQTVQTSGRPPMAQKASNVFPATMQPFNIQPGAGVMPFQPSNQFNRIV